MPTFELLTNVNWWTLLNRIEIAGNIMSVVTNVAVSCPSKGRGTMARVDTMCYLLSTCSYQSLHLDMRLLSFFLGWLKTLNFLWYTQAQVPLQNHQVTSTTLLGHLIQLHQECYQICILWSSLRSFFFNYISYQGGLFFQKTYSWHFYHNHATKEFSRGKMNKISKKQQTSPEMLILSERRY